MKGEKQHEDNIYTITISQCLNLGEEETPLANQITHILSPTLDRILHANTDPLNPHSLTGILLLCVIQTLRRGNEKKRKHICETQINNSLILALQGEFMISNNAEFKYCAACTKSAALQIRRKGHCTVCILNRETKKQGQF